MNQARFDTVLNGDAVIRQLYMCDEQQVKEGTSFNLELMVPIRSSDKVIDKILTLVVDRCNAANFVFTHANKDKVFVVLARIEPKGESFWIDITIPYDTNHMEGASVTVSSEMKRIIIAIYLARRNSNT